MKSLPYFTVWKSDTGRWCVVHKAPGCAPTVDLDCPSLAAAEHEAAWMNAERERDQQRQAEERALCGVRA